jgi:amino acid adenylation domain-containing protein
VSSKGSNSTVIGLIESACARNPDATAVIADDENLTFGQLWARATSLASELVLRGVDREDLVGVWALQSSSYIVSVVAVMIAGAAFVPLDPSYPRERLEYLVSDADLRLIVAPPDSLTAAAQMGIPVASSRVTSEAPPAMAVSTRPDDAMYVIYTSGSTGQPKGVTVEHHSMVDHLRWLIEEFEIGPGDLIMGTSSLAFDGSLPNYLSPLVSGATFVALKSEITKDVRAIAQAIKRHQPRIFQTTPAILSLLTQFNWEGDPDLIVWVGGEKLSAATIRHLSKRVHSLYNFYGPTEATVSVTMARLQSQDVDSPIGRPLEHIQCFLRNEDGAPTPPGEVGELYIAGSQLARGYLNRPELTAERFVTVADDAGALVRAYRTGDLATVKPDGSILLIGRSDDQVKIRGYRIEPGEIEQRLVDHPAVVEAVVVAHRENDADEPQLVAFLRTDGEVSLESLRSFATQTLPGYMVPSFIIKLDRFPLTPTTKVDRRLLAEMPLSHEGFAIIRDVTQKDDPTDDLQTELLNMFADVLEIEPSSFGVNDDFFDYGGTSLRCMELFMSIEEHYDVSLPVTTLARAPTVRLLARVLRSVIEGKDGGLTVAKSAPDWEWVLAILWSEILDNRRINSGDDFFQLGGTDDDARRMLRQLMTIYATSATLDELRRASTVAAFAALTHGRSLSSSLVPIQSVGRKVPLFCIAGPGGLALSFLPLSRLLGDDQPLYAIQSHGLERRGVPDMSFERAAKRYVKLIRSVQPHGPYLIGGHSMGGLVALLTAQQLEDQGEEVALLAIFETILPSRIAGSAAVEDGGSTAVKHFSSWRPLNWRRDIVKTLRLPLTGLVPWRGIAQYEAFEFHARVQAKFARRPKPWRGRAILFVSEDERAVEVESSWSSLLAGPWLSVSIPGDHTGILQRPYVEHLAPILRAEMEATLASRAD